MNTDNYANDELRRLNTLNQELLAALQRVLPFVDCCAAITGDDIREYEAALKAADAAIAKAQGGAA